MACTEGFQKHSYRGDGGTCIRCGAARPANQQQRLDDSIARDPDAPPNVTGRETLDDIARETEGGAIPPEKKPRRSKKVSDVDDAASKILARANARSIVLGIEGAKRFAAERAGFHWNGAALVPQEEAELIEQLTQVCLMYGFDINNPKVALILLVLTEIRITVRQISILTAQREEAIPPDARKSY